MNSRYSGILLAENQRLSLGLITMLKLLLDSQVPSELLPYRDSIIKICQKLNDMVAENLLNLEFSTRETSILDNIRSNTVVIRHWHTRLNEILLLPIKRTSEHDRLSLALIKWLYEAHGILGLQPVIIDGNFQVSWYVRSGIAPIYSVPIDQQLSLLYLPLIFHEFGHVLYHLNKPEMDDLVKELREAIAEILRPRSRRNDQLEERQQRQRQQIVNDWYGWAQELYCDAIGMVIGGPSYLRAFSSYLIGLEVADFRIESLGVSHPPTWLRVQILVDQACNSGYVTEADIIRSTWQDVKSALNLRDEYRGYYHPQMKPHIREVLDNMVEESNPRIFDPKKNENSPVTVLNEAWEIFLANRQTYEDWQVKGIESLFQILASGELAQN